MESGELLKIKTFSRMYAYMYISKEINYLLSLSTTEPFEF